MFSNLMSRSKTPQEKPFSSSFDNPFRANLPVANLMFSFVLKMSIPLTFCLFIYSACIFACLCLHVHVYAGAHACVACVYGDQGTTSGVFPLGFSRQDLSLAYNSPSYPHSGPLEPAHLCLLKAGITSVYHHARLSFSLYCRFWGLSSGSHARKSGTSPAAASPQLSA